MEVSLDRAGTCAPCLLWSSLINDIHDSPGGVAEVELCGQEKNSPYTRLCMATLVIGMGAAQSW